MGTKQNSLKKGNQKGGAQEQRRNENDKVGATQSEQSRNDRKHFQGAQQPQPRVEMGTSKLPVRGQGSN